MDLHARAERIRELAERMTERMAHHWPEGDLTVNDIEALAERVAHDVQHEISERFLQEEAERKAGNQLACPCGQRARYQRHHALPLATLSGRVVVRRAYYYCRGCGKGFCPADGWLGLGAANTTPAAQARLAVLAALEPYVQIDDLLAQLGLPLKVDLKSTERVAQAVGTQLAQQQLRPFGKAERPLAVGFDGVLYPTWEGNKEARVGVIYEPEWNAPRTPAAEAGLRKEYFATTGSRESLVALVAARARERAGNAVVAVVADGQALDWVDLDQYLPKRVEILDFYHVMERVAVIATALHPEAALAAEWRAARREELLTQGPRKLLKALRAWQPEPASQELKRVQLAYFERQQERMRYPNYLRRGFPIGSGAVEGACKHVVTARFERSGMRWKPATAEPVLRLRAALLTQPRLDLRAVAASRHSPIVV